MVLQFLGLATSSCSTEFGPVDRSAKATIDFTETESNLASPGRGIVGASSYGPGKVPGDNDPEPENSRWSERSSYLPELGSFVGEDSLSDVSDLCTDIPKEFFESVGITETHPKLPGDGDSNGYGPCVGSLEGKPDVIELNFSAMEYSLPDSPGYPHLSTSRTDSGNQIQIESSDIGALRGCTASTQTVEGSLLVRYVPEENPDPSEVCPDAEHWLRTILTADGQDKYGD